MTRDKQVTEKAVARLAELVPAYKDLLRDREVYEHFAGLVSRAKKFATVEMQQAIGEWEKTLKEVGGLGDRIIEYDERKNMGLRAYLFLARTAFMHA